MSKQKSKVKSEKTQNFLSSKVQKDVKIYEIYRSCRLCGAGTGYKMPIVQNIIPIEDTEVDLKTKIQECLQLEVQENDKMPPLICELCADKISDFYDFLIMCKQTNKRTRMRLGLPMPVSRKEVIDTTEPIVKIETKETEKGSIKKAKDVKVAVNGVKNEIKKESRAEKELRDLIASNPVLSMSQRSPYNRTREDRKSPKDSQVRPGPASSKFKRFREIVFNEVQSKKVKIEEPRSKRLCSVKVTDNSKTSDMQKCDVCKIQFPKGTSFNNHYRIHKKVETLVTKPQRETQDSKDETNFVGKCRKCGKLFKVHRTFVKHQAACRGGRVKIPYSVRKGMKPVQVRMIRCDSLLCKDDNGHYDVSDVRCPYGLDRSCLYPYNKNNSLLRCNRMVDIKFPEIPDAFGINDDVEEFLHWDSDSESDHNRKEVESLSTLAIKVIFSDNFLGKIPRKRKKVKPFYEDFGLNIDRIISNLSETNESQSIFDNIKENWSDNVSDSILRNDNESDTFSVIGDFNDDTGSYTDTLNNEINYKTNDCDGPSTKNDTIETNRLGDNRSSQICMLELNKKHNLAIIGTNTNDLPVNCNRSPEITPSTDNNSIIDTQKCSNNTGVSENTSCSDQLNFEKTNNHVDNINTLKSEIELLEIQILNDNDEEDCVNRCTENIKNEPTDVIFKQGAISSEIEPNIIAAEISKTCESLVESICNETVPHNQDCEIAVENISTERRTDRIGEYNENCVKGNVNNDNINVNTDTNDKNTDVFVSCTTNTKNINFSFQAMEDTLKEITPNLNRTNDYNKECINYINIEPESSRQDSLSLPHYFNINGKENVQNETQNMTDVNKIEDTTKSVNFEANSMEIDIYNELIENNILGDEIDTVHRMGHKSNGVDKINSNDLEDISDDEIDNEKSNITLDYLLPDKSMDLDSISDGEFTLED
ncbi:unnamed protein product [Pieris brassicae]|uniref:ZAD domain-containing protein n=1 Tax=Pieris brassicae TaxID=7116 RepID=A0A9P0TNE2_PIEBR|nr:unnamed protein product [Pieris brassicae]